MKTKGTVKRGGEGLVVRSQGGGSLYNHSGVVHCTCHYRPAGELFHGDAKLRLAFSPSSLNPDSVSFSHILGGQGWPG